MLLTSLVLLTWEGHGCRVSRDFVEDTLESLEKYVGARFSIGGGLGGVRESGGWPGTGGWWLVTQARISSGKTCEIDMKIRKEGGCCDRPGVVSIMHSHRHQKGRREARG